MCQTPSRKAKSQNSKYQQSYHDPLPIISPGPRIQASLRKSVSFNPSPTPYLFQNQPELHFPFHPTTHSQVSCLCTLCSWSVDSRVHRGFSLHKIWQFLQKTSITVRDDSKVLLLIGTSLRKRYDFKKQNNTPI